MDILYNICVTLVIAPVLIHIMKPVSRGCKTVPAVRWGFVLLCGVVIGVAVAIGVGWLRCVDKVLRPLPPPPSMVGRYRSGAVATDAAECSQIGTDMLTLHNGTAVDAAIAALICVGVANMHSTGIGGGSFAIVYDSSTDEVSGHDFREVAPKAASRDMFVDRPGETEIGPLPIAVPGDVAGYHSLHTKYGRVPWADLWAPTIAMLEDGMPVGAALARWSAAAVKAGEGLQYGLRERLHNPVTDKTIARGDRLYLPKLVATFKRIAAAGGADDFYRGHLAKDIVADLNDVGSIITAADLADYKVKTRLPLRSSIAGYDVYSLPAPSGGPVLQFILNIIRNYKFTPASIATPTAKALTYHRIIEAMKFAYAKRSELGDPAFVNNTDIISAMMSPTYGEQIRGRITDSKTHKTSYYGAKFTTVDDHGTTHLSVVDKEGTAVGITSTINLRFGSKVVGSRTGILFNDDMDDFCTPGLSNYFGVPPSQSNFIQPGKRPLSSMTPVIVKKGGEVHEVTGAAGGTKIITATVLTLIRTLLLGQDLQTAMDTPRFHHQLVPTTLGIEPTLSKDIKQRLESKGHVTKPYRPQSNNVHTVIRSDPYLFAASDGRKGGAPDGY